MKLTAITIGAFIGPWIGNIITEPIHTFILLPIGRGVVYAMIWFLF